MFPENLHSPVPRQGLLASCPVSYCAPLRAPSPLEIKLPVPAPHVDNTYAEFVWNASVILADLIVCEDIQVTGKKVLELGCGAGLPGIVAARKGAELVILSDFDDPAMLEDCENGIAEAVPAPLRSRMQVVGHTWGSSVAKLLLASHDRPFDMILLSDVFWTPASHRPLIETLLKLSFSSSTPIIHFTAGFHSGRRVLRNFLAMAYEEEFEKVGTWYEISTVGEQKEWRDREEVAEVEESQEVRNRWSLVGALRLRL